MIHPPTPLVARLLPPAIGRLHLRRPRLMDRLRASLAKRVTLVLAGPGYGKTSLLSRFLQESASTECSTSRHPSRACGFCGGSWPACPSPST